MEENQKLPKPIEHHYFNEIPFHFKSWTHFYVSALKGREFEKDVFGISKSFSFAFYEDRDVEITKENPREVQPHKHIYKFSSVEFIKAKCYDESVANQRIDPFISNKILEFYGEKNQKIKMIEELSELASALSRNLNDKNGPAVVENVMEEMADVELVMSQMYLIFDRNRINQILQQKINRTVDYVERHSETIIHRIK